MTAALRDLPSPVFLGKRTNSRRDMEFVILLGPKLSHLPDTNIRSFQKIWNLNKDKK